MIGEELFIARFSTWAPNTDGVSSNEGKAPEIAFTDSLFRRRLSQISKMTIQVVHDLLPLDENIKMIFLSFRGELARQYKINKMVIEDKAIMPAAFSLSVFNAPIALASIALGLKGGYTAIYPGKNSFATGLAVAEATLLSGANEVLFVYADEEVPQEYKSLSHSAAYRAPPLAFALLLTKKPCPNCISLSSIIKKGNDSEGSQSAGFAIRQTFGPIDFLRQIILCKENYASP
jgi:hypothetical protein